MCVCVRQTVGSTRDCGVFRACVGAWRRKWGIHCRRQPPHCIGIGIGIGIGTGIGIGIGTMMFADACVCDGAKSLVASTSGGRRSAAASWPSTKP